MSNLSLREAARASGTSRSTLLRRIQTGRLPATRADDGVYAINPEELQRICPPRPDAGKDGASRAVAARPDLPSRNELDLRVHIARLEAEVAALRDALDAERRRADEVRQERDRWHEQADRLAAREPNPAEMPRAVERGLQFLRWAKTEAGG